MKVKIQPGRVVRLTPSVNSSLRRGGEYDLDALGVSPEQQKAILALEGVTEVKASAPTATKKAGDE
jgi:hypothetical protein